MLNKVEKAKRAIVDLIVDWVFISRLPCLFWEHEA